MRIYNSFINRIGSTSHTDLHIYHCDETLFLNLLEKNSNAYDYYIIMTHFKTENLKHVSFTQLTENAIKKIPKEKLLLLDNEKLHFNTDYNIIYQDFENDIYNALKDGLQKISKYKKLFLAYPSKSLYPYPRRILHGFRKFCIENNLDF